MIIFSQTYAYCQTSRILYSPWGETARLIPCRFSHIVQSSGSAIMALYRPIPRRKFFQVSAAAAFAGGVLGACSGRNGPWRFLTAAEAALVDSIAAQIIPEDQDAGGRIAGVVNFIDIQLTGHYKRHQEI